MTEEKETQHGLMVKLTPEEKASLIIWSVRNGHRGAMGTALLAAAKLGAPDMFSQT